MRQKIDPERKILIERYKGVAYDKTLIFNSIKEKKQDPKIKKRNVQTDNIINAAVETELIQNAFLIEEKLVELTKISKHQRELF